MNKIICRDCPYLIVETNSSIYYCEKLQEVIKKINCCEDKDHDKYISENKPKRKRKSTRERDLKYKARLKRQAKLYHGVYYQEERYVKGEGFVPLEKPYYRRVYRGNNCGNRYTYYKKYANHRVRNFSGAISNGGGYKRVFDYWWTVD